MLEELTKTLTGSQYVNADSYAIQEDIIQNYKQHGAQSVSLITQALFFCISLWFLVHFVSQVFRMSETHAAMLWEPMGALSHAQLFAGIEQSYVFWDPFHLTETANSIVAKHMLWWWLESTCKQWTFENSQVLNMSLQILRKFREK